MPRTISVGRQDFEKLREHNNFYVDKTGFIREWWETDDEVTLITRPRRFGKTLNMSMVETFFSVAYAGRGGLFEGLSIWQEEKYRNLQGTYPVIALSFANVKETSCENAKRKICQAITKLYNRFDFLPGSGKLNDKEKEAYQKVTAEMEDYIATDSLNALSGYLTRYYGKRVILLLDEYDTPMQEAYVHGYWEEIAAFMRSLFNAAFKTNPYLERAILTGITRASKESIFSDLNNLEVVTTTSDKYADKFGFTEEEVFTALDEFGLTDRREEVKLWYDGFVFGSRADIYNPWSIINYLNTGKTAPYWANSSSNDLVSKLIREGDPELKMTMERLLQGESFHTTFDEQMVFSQLDQDDGAVWSLLLASGYVKAENAKLHSETGRMEYDLRLTNREVRSMFLQLIEGWFGKCRRIHNAFLRAMLDGDLESMNEYMNEISCELFSSFDTGRGLSGRTQPGRTGRTD